MPDPVEAAALSAATRGVLETMFFTDVQGEAPGPVVSPEAAAIDARLHFSGERPGDFRVAVAPQAARTIAANFLGFDDEGGITESEVCEVAGELANMICGSALSHLAGGVAFELSHPEVGRGAGAGGWPEEAARTFDLGNGWLTAAIRFERP
jgi:CheY-specific phosphatase CheX